MSIFTRLADVGKRTLVGLLGVGALVGTTGLVAAQTAQAETGSTTVTAGATDNTGGCSYGQGGPKADALCWIDLSSFGNVSAADLANGSVTKSLEITVGRYIVTADAVISAGADGASGVNATVLPTWGGAVLGSVIDGQNYYTGTSGKPALYQNQDGAISKDNSIRDTVTLNNITVKDTKNGNAAVTSGYSLVMADAESTGTGEGFVWSSDKPLNEYQQVVPSNWSKPCTDIYSGLGTTKVTCTSAKNTTSGGRGITMVSADSPTTMTSSFNNASYSDSREGVAFALVFSTAVPGVQVDQKSGSDAEFTTTSSTGGSATSKGDKVTSNEPFLGGSTGTSTTYTVQKSGGNTPEAAYDITWSCTVNGSAVTPVLSADGKSATVTTPENGASSCVATATAKPPVTGNDSKTVDPNTTAELSPVTTPGAGAIDAVAFDNGQKTKTVAGEGTWTIELVDGQPKATFTPEAGFTGKVTEQSYTVTDVNGLTATGKLDVTIKPTTGDASKTINPNTTAELTPKTIPGSGEITGAAFADGSTTKTVPGEGTWTIKVVDGQPVATFTPDKDYTGKVTPQSYTVTDANGLTASGKLDVTINVPPTTGDASKTINPNETAELSPTATQGTGAITSAAFADGSTTKTVPGEGTWTIKLVDGQPKATFTPDKDYTGKVTEQPYTVTDVNGLTASGKLDVTINVPPTTGDASKTINPNETAELSPTATQGTGAITSAAFADGSTTKTVPGEGTWTIKLVDGQPKATFTPDKDYTGKVTEQPYTVTDVNDLTATGKLDVTINVPPTTGDASKTINPNTTAELSPETTQGTGDIKTVTFADGSTTKTIPGEGTWTIKLVDGQPKATFTPDKDYTGKVTEQSYTVTDANGLSATGKLDVTINVPPTTGDASKTVGQGESATLMPKSTKGTGAIDAVAFDNGQKTKTVAGEGTWTIELVGGQPKATFTPEAGFTGKVTEQSYTVTDVNGLTATGKLDVTIKPTTGDASKTINPNTTAELTPKTIPGSGDITAVTFDNGQQSKTVAGEGTWTIELVEGQPKATFTPDKDYTGKVTPQSYTVTDANGLTASGKLDVTINVPPTTGDASKTINPNETATLTPKTIPGTGEITKVVFDNGQQSKTVPGEGTWTIKLVDGQPVATFTPDKDYSGKVTPQSYTVTDVNGLSATGKLEVTIKVPVVPTPAPSSDGSVPAPAGKSLAHTGAAVASVLAVAGVLAALGFAVLRIRKHSNN